MLGVFFCETAITVHPHVRSAEFCFSAWAWKGSRCSKAMNLFRLKRTLKKMPLVGHALRSDSRMRLGSFGWIMSTLRCRGVEGKREKKAPPPPSHKKPESCDDHAPTVLSNFSPPPGSLRSPPGVAGGEVATQGGGNIDKKADGRPEEPTIKKNEWGRVNAQMLKQRSGMMRTWAVC